MIAYLAGHVIAVNPSSVTLLVGAVSTGVGYKVHILPQEAESLKPGDAAALHIHYRGHEGGVDLYGFARTEELRLFELLITVDGVGPKVAMGTIASAGYAALVSAIRANDAALLRQAKGVGAKTAAKIVLELSNKLGDLPGGEFAPPRAAVSDDLVSALMGLGFRRGDIERRLAGADLGGDDLTEQLRRALSLLSSS